MRSNFLLGELRLQGEARIRLKRIPMDLIARHAVQDHGYISANEAAANETAMKNLGEIKSRFYIDPTNKQAGTVLVITCRTWSATTVEVE